MRKLGIALAVVILVLTVASPTTVESASQVDQKSANGPDPFCPLCQ